VLPLVDRADLRWTDLGTSTTQPFAAVNIVSRTYVVSSTPDFRGVVVRRRSDDAVVARHDVDLAEYVPVFADIAGNELVVVDEDAETNGDGVKSPARPYVYDLLTGRSTRLSDIASAPAPSAFGRQATVTDDGRYFYSASVDRPGNRDSNCVAMLDLHTLRGSLVECAGDGENESDGYYLGAGEDGATWVHVQGPTMESCRTGRGVTRSTLVPVGPAGGCATLGTASVGGWSVWSATDKPAGTPVPTVRLFAARGADVVRLGDVNGVALTACGAYAYWRTEDPGTHGIQVRRWKPGSSTVEIAYRVNDQPNASAGRQLVFGGCADGILSVLSFVADASTSTYTVQILALEP
jgi:hypothetical protein